RAYGLGGADKLYGNAGNDKLYGGEGNDSLYGSGSNDLLVGGTGDDSYYVTNSTVTVQEQPGEGTDWAYVYNYNFPGYTLADNVENLAYFVPVGYSSTLIALTGNGLDNIIIGGDQADTLTGLGGNDTLFGGKGADTLDGGA